MTKTILITGLRAPVALHFCRLFAAAGWRVYGADSLCHPVGRFSGTVKRYFQLPSPRAEPEAFAKAIGSIVAETDPRLILPTCEEVFHLARAAVQPDAANWAQRLYAPPIEDLIKLHDKAAFNALVARVAPDFAPRFHALDRLRDVTALGDGRWVFKPRFSRFATEVGIAPVRAGAVVPAGALRLPITPEQPWLAQAYLPGEEVCVSAVVSQGQVLALQAYKPLVRLRGGLGAGIAFAASGDEVTAQLRPLVDAVAGALGLTGQVSFDLRRDAEGQWKTLECNPRATSGFVFFGPDDGLVEAVDEGRAVTIPLKRPEREVLGEALPSLLFGGWPGLALCLGLLRTKPGPYRRLQALSQWPGDGISAINQARAFSELFRRALAQRCSLEKASTLDICWDGPADRL